MTTTATSVSTHLVAHGTGSPEGAVTRAVGAVYVQEDASPTIAAVWYKATGSGNTGWVQIAVDTDGTLAAASNVKLPSQAAVKTYVDGKVNGLSWKQAVRAASTANGTLATAFENADTLDGVTLATGDRILLKNQSAGAENGIYVVAASGAPARATDADSGAELVNATVYVSEGTTNADTAWTCTTNATITPGSTSLAFAQSGGGAPSGSAGGDLSGTYPNPTVAKLTTTSGPTALTIGTITDGEFLKRSGSTIVSGSLTGGVGGMTLVYLSGDNTGITTIADIANLQLTVGANEIWEVEWGLVCNMTSTSGAKFRWTADGGAVSVFTFFGLLSSSTTPRMDTLGEVTDSIAYNTFTGSNALTTVKGVYINGAGGTTLKLRATGQGATTCTVKKGSWMRATRYA